MNAYSEGWLTRGFPWVYPKEVVSGPAAVGQWVEVRGPTGKLLGRGLWDDGWIAVRMFPDDLDAVLARAKALRDQVVPQGTTGYRLLHGENDGVPGVRIDWWDGRAVVALDSPALAPVLDPVTTWLRALGARAVWLCYRPDARDRSRGSFRPTPGLVAGDASEADVAVCELGAQFLVRPHDGPDVGLYADMRPIRAWLAPHWRGRRVLNTFAYTGAFSVAAALGGAAEVVSVDTAQPALARARANFAANGLDPESYEFDVEDTFKALDRIRRTGRRFDLVLLDPPSFSRGEATWSAEKDYRRLVGSACRVLDPGGWLVCASNQGQVSPHAFRGFVADGVRKADRAAQEIHWATAGQDFPAATWFPEAHYLKVGVWRVL